MSAQASPTPVSAADKDLPLRADAVLWGWAAVIGGATAALRLTLPDDAPIRLGLAALLVLAWQVAWSSLVEADWREALRSWRTWSRRRRLPRLPYTMPDAPAARTAAWLETWISWWQEWLIPSERLRLSLLVVSVGSGVILSAALGSYALALTLGAWLAAQLAALLNATQPLLWFGRSLVQIGLPLLLGFGLFGAPDAAFAAIAIGLSLADAGTAQGARLRRDVGYALVLGALLFTRQPIGAFGLSLVWLPQVLLSPLRRPRVWFLAALAIVSLTLAA